MNSINLKNSLYLSRKFFLNKEKSLNETMLCVILGSILLTLSSKISIPFYPVPMTMQSFAVLFLSGLFGFRLAFMTSSLYLFQGALGLPVFANGGGIMYMISGTGGYLLGFLVASMIAGYVSDCKNNQGFVKTLLFFGLAHISIFVFGVAWLTKFMTLEKALQVGFYPFILGAIIKFSAVSIILHNFWSKNKI